MGELLKLVYHKNWSLTFDPIVQNDELVIRFITSLKIFSNFDSEEQS